MSFGDQKHLLEQGTGTTVLTTYFDKETSDIEFAEKKKQILEEDDVVITSKEQLLYYGFFKKHFGKPSDIYNEKIDKQCPNCKSYVQTHLDSAKSAEITLFNFLFLNLSKNKSCKFS